MIQKLFQYGTKLHISRYNFRPYGQLRFQSNTKLVVDSNVSKRKIEKLLIANRGEIACRIIRTARILGIETVAVYSDADRNSMHVSMADEAYHIGPSPAIESYLVKEKLIDVAYRSGSNAIHPGYGFLSENFEFATMCSEQGIKFVGPSPDSIKSMGIKSLSKSIMINAGVPVIPGFHDDSIQGENDLLNQACQIGFPVMIKAVRGGGGKGMRISRSKEDFIQQLESAKREAMKSFGDQVVLLEKFVSRPRHIEVQIFGDQHGNCVHLFERDCSSQRRHQKVIEEAPAPHINSTTREELGMAAVRAAQAVKYEGAGTVEFIFDTNDKKFYFMEMNTRLQVEHPVTEMVTGLDLVEWQLRIASGEPLPKSQIDFINPNGHAFEARIYAEDAESNFMPCTGFIESLTLPTSVNSNDIRIETGVRKGDEVSVFYDPMIAKLAVWAPDRNSALMKLRQSLHEYRLTGLKTNIDYLIRLASHSKFESGDIYTDFIADYSDELKPMKCSDSRQRNRLCAIAALSLIRDEKNLDEKLKTKFSNDINSPFSRPDIQLLNSGLQLRMIQLRNTDDNTTINVQIGSTDSSQYQITIEDDMFDIKLNSYEDDQLDLNFPNEGFQRTYKVLTDNNARSSSIFTKQNGVFQFELVLPKSLESSGTDSSQSDGFFDGRSITSPMPAVVEKILVSVGDIVNNGDTVAILTAMKMENVIKATFEDESQTRKVEQVFCQQGDSVSKGAKLVQFEEQ
ncbi:Methylcrotonoyl-CoA carboxylase subunit alpha, mitochondrial [Blomia tropicalis]|nr:Methylcrotonoyl-CoA carboxylase subunit alpha, mitochondrial [Blomia tropicalis]